MEPRINSGALPSAGPGNDLSPDIDAEGALVCRALETRPEPVGECRADAPDPAANAAVRGLIETYENSRHAPASARPVAPAPADTNSRRTAERNSSGAYAEAGVTRSGDSYFIGLAALKTRDPATGMDAEMFSASAQVGAQTELQVGLARVGYSTAGEGLNLAVTVEAMTARANLGIHNDDGTHGANGGAGATVLGTEATVGYAGWSVTAGLAFSVGVQLSSGEHDADGDGTPERCFKGSIGVATLGVCTEL